MFYLILAIMLVLFYIFIAPRNIKGTMNLIASVFLLVALAIALVLGFLRIMQFPKEIWVGLLMILIGFWAMRDIYYLDKVQIQKNLMSHNICVLRPKTANIFSYFSSKCLIVLEFTFMSMYIFCIIYLFIFA